MLRGGEERDAVIKPWIFLSQKLHRVTRSHAQQPRTHARLRVSAGAALPRKVPDAHSQCQTPGTRRASSGRAHARMVRTIAGRSGLKTWQTRADPRKPWSPTPMFQTREPGVAFRGHTANQGSVFWVVSSLLQPRPLFLRPGTFKPHLGCLAFWKPP